MEGKGGRRQWRARLPPFMARRPHRATDDLAAWLARAGGCGWLAGAGGLAGVGGRGHGGRRAWRRPGAGEGGRSGQAALLSCSRNGYCSGTRTAMEVIPGSAAPRIRARHCRAKIGGAAEPCHVNGQRFWSPPRQPSAAPPCMARHRHLAALGQ